MVRFGLRGMVAAAAATVGLGLSATGASADVINVPGGNGKSIQDGVDRAEPGDTVRIHAKQRPYFENVEVTTNRITLQGVSRGGRLTVIDGTSRNGTNHDLTLDIDADKVSVRGIQSRHGYGIDCTGDECFFKGIHVSMSDQGGDCVEIDGNRGVVRESRFVGCDDNAIDLDGNANKVRDNYARQSDSSCVYSRGDRNEFTGNTILSCEDGNGIQHNSGDDGLIAGNSIRNTDYDGIEQYNGDGFVVRNNRVRNTEEQSIYVNGDRSLVKNNVAKGSNSYDCYDVDGSRIRVIGNRATFCDGGYELDGENLKVKNNRVVFAGDDDAFDISCNSDGVGDASASCENAEIVGNYAQGNNNDDEGYDIYASYRGMLIKDNVAKENNDGGFYLSVDAARIVGNVSRRDGAEGNEPGFDLYGDDNRVKDNFAFSSGDDGIQVSSGDDNRLIANRVVRSNIDGIHVESGAGHVVRRNVTQGNYGDGIENDASDVRLVKNVSSGNRKDCVNDGTIAVKRGNRCADGSNFGDPGTVDRRRR